MASKESSPTLDRKPSDEKQVGFNAPIDITGIDAPAALDPSHAAEYLEFLELKEHFESDPKAYKSLVRRRRFSLEDNRPEHQICINGSCS